jgi:hypothetical protein
MTVTYTNDRGEHLTLRQRKPFFIQRVGGAGTVNNLINTFKAPNQDGAFYISSSLDMRNITLEGAIVGQSPDEAYEFRKRLLRVFTPKLSGTLVYRGYQIPCIVEEASFIAGVRERVPSFFISLLCPSPFFEALEELRMELALWASKFSFVLEIPQSGIEFALRQPSQIITVENPGDVACGCTIMFKALGTLTNPELLNVDTGEVFRLIKTMSAGEEIVVHTHFANKRVVQIVSGTEVNIFSHMDTSSVFIQLMPGRSTLRYDAATNMELLEVSLYYRPLFLGV